MNERRRSFAGRDQALSTFGGVLMRLCDAVGALGAALVDAEGETVDYACSVDPFDMKVIAAESSILFYVLRQSAIPTWPETEEICLRGTKKSIYLQSLDEGYSIVLLLVPYAFSVSRRALSEAIREICAEAGFQLPPSYGHEKEHWSQIDVRCAEGTRRPAALWSDGEWCPVEVLGSYTADLIPREVGYRARLSSGAEVTLVRERLGRWYADVRPGK